MRGLVSVVCLWVSWSHQWNTFFTRVLGGGHCGTGIQDEKQAGRLHGELGFALGALRLGLVRSAL